MAVLLAASQLRVDATAATPAAWTLPELCGRLVELLDGVPSAALTLAVSLVADAQRRQEPVAWVTRPDALFYPPDLTSHGIDLAALPVVRAPSQTAQLRAAEPLLRSGAFGLVVLDLAEENEVPVAAQVRLAALAKQHATTLLCLTRSASRQGSLASLRAVAQRRRAGDRLVCCLHAEKDKRRGRPWEWAEVVQGPIGMR